MAANPQTFDYWKRGQLPAPNLGKVGTTTFDAWDKTQGFPAGETLSGGGAVHGSATIFGCGSCNGGVAGAGGISHGFAASGGFLSGLAGSGAVGDGLAGQGLLHAASTALNDATLSGSGSFAGGLAGAGAVAAGVAGSGGLGGGLAGAGAVGGGVAGAGSVLGKPAALASALFQGAGALAGNFLAGVGNLTASGMLGGAIHGAATLLGTGAMLLGFGGSGTIQASSAATPGITLKGTGALGGGVAGAGSVNASSAATPSQTLQGSGALSTGQAGSGSLSASSAATPSISFKGMGALLAGLFGGQGIVPSPAATITGQIVGVFRWLFTAASTLLPQAFAPRMEQTLVFGGTQFLLFTFLREPNMQVQPNSTIQVVMTAKKYDGTLQSGLVTVTCTVTFPDGTTENFSLSSGIQNTGSGTYTLTYTTKGVGENVENWVGTDSAGNTSNYQNVTPVSY